MIHGATVELRSLGDGDAPAVFAIFSDPEVMRFWSSPPLEDLAAATKLIHEIRAAYADRRLFQWGVFPRGGNEALGTCTLFNVDPAHRRAEVGFALRRTAWGKGIATAALDALIDFSFRTLDLHRLEADVDPRNDRSLRVLERQGFRREGHLRERWHHLGEIHDGIFLGLLRREWRGGNAPPPAPQ